jgi:hypothetical protein
MVSGCLPDWQQYDNHHRQQQQQQHDPLDISSGSSDTSYAIKIILPMSRPVEGTH